MKIKMLKTSRCLSNSARTLTVHKEGYIYDISESDAKVIVDSGDARYAEDHEEPPLKRWQVAAAKKKATKKKKSKKSKNVVEPPIPEPDMDIPPEPEEESDGQV